MDPLCVINLNPLQPCTCNDLEVNGGINSHFFMVHQVIPPSIKWGYFFLLFSNIRAKLGVVIVDVLLPRRENSISYS